MAPKNRMNNNKLAKFTKTSRLLAPIGFDSVPGKDNPEWMMFENTDPDNLNRRFDYIAFERLLRTA
jgi:hypothetical protein